MVSPCWLLSRTLRYLLNHIRGVLVGFRHVQERQTTRISSMLAGLFAGGLLDILTRQSHGVRAQRQRRHSIEDGDAGCGVVWRTALIQSTTRIDEVIHHLTNHGCEDITSNLDPHDCTLHPVARGGYGAVYLGRLLDGRPVAIKCIDALSNLDGSEDANKNTKRAARELYTWSKCDHPGVLKLFGFARFRGQVALISPWMTHGSLSIYITRQPLVNRLLLCVHLAEALEYLHSRNITHGDIKPDNAIMSEQGHPQLADFGNATLKAYTTLQFTQTTCSKITPRFAAPELLKGTSGYTHEADIYALGMTMLQTLTGKAPFANKTDHAIIYAVTIERSLPSRSEFSHALRDSYKASESNLWDLLVWCWSYAPEARPTASEVKRALVDIEQGVYV